MNKNALDQLEYFKVKQRVEEYAVSYLGSEHVEEMQPMTEIKRIRTKLDETEEALSILKTGGSVPIPSLKGMESVLQLLGKGYVFGEEDFSNILTFLNSCSQLKRYMDAKKSLAAKISSYASSIYVLEKLQSEIERCLQNGRILDTASKDLNKVRKKITVLDERIKTKLNQLMTKNRDILQENFVNMRGNHYVLPIKKEYRKRMNGSVLDESSSGQTVYIEPAELNRFSHELVDLRNDEAREEAKILGYLTGLVEQVEQELRINTETVGIYDFLFAKAKYALAAGGCNVEVNDQGVMDIQEACHPLMGPEMIPLDFSIGLKYKQLIITGPNTGGKTVALKTIGLLTLMVQSGLLVPVKTGSKFSIYREVAVDIGDGQSIEHSLSTFSSHISNVIEILSYADHSTLILLDEMATGTDPGEGVSLAIAILEELHRRGSTVVATTHFNEIKHFAAVVDGFENARMEFNAETLQPLYQLHIGDAGESYAFLIARKLGIASELIRRSREIMESRGAIDEHVKEEPPQIDTLPIKQQHPQVTLKDDSNLDKINSRRSRRFEVGDSVYVSYLKRTGIVFKEEDTRGSVGVLIQKQKIYINHKRLSLHIEKKELYPEDYDLDIVLETKENRKKKKLMNRKHVDGLSITRKPDED